MMFITLAFILEGPEVITQSYLNEILMTLLGVLVLVIVFFLKALWSDFNAVKLQVYKNKEAIAKNIEKDKSDQRDFLAYQKLIAQKDEHFESTLRGLDLTLKELVQITRELSVEVAKLQENIKNV